MIRKHSKPIAICPYLRSIGRPSSEPVARPDYLHCCTACQQMREVTPRTQIGFCLIDEHKTCPFFAVPGAAAVGQAAAGPARGA